MDIEERYSWSDRLLHRLAFRLGITQETLADVEATLYRDTLRSVSLRDPVFISSLPRAGTTILLRLLWKTGQFATHTYRDMPFVLCPMIWRRFSRTFVSDDEPRERAHGDGIEISGRSPEAFEEMVWKHFWSDPYRDDRIVPWTDGDRNAAFNAFFERHMRKVVALHSDEASGSGRGSGTGDAADSLRYLSKNNLNISRLAALPPPLHQGTFVIPVRKPLQQAASMYRQHQRFQEIHRRDDFIREYMEAIGHHEFGQGLKPVNFNDWLDEDPADPDDLSFWLRYWTEAYRFVLQHLPSSAVIVAYDRLVDDPAPVLDRLNDRLDLNLSAEVRTELAADIRPPRNHEIDRGALDADLVDRAHHIYRRMRERAGAGNEMSG